MMDPTVYVNYNKLQIETSKKFIESVVPSSSDWCLEIVMDIGCGPGNTSTHWIDQYFPSIRRLIGVDIDPGMIDLAKQNNKKHKIEYYVADIMKKDNFEEWEGSVTTVLSTYVFHRVTNQRRAFKNVFDLLKPGGTAAVAFIVVGPFYLAYEDLLRTPKWKPILERTKFVFPESYVKKYDVAYYRQMFEDIGFSVSLCITKPVEFSYDTDEECKNLLLSMHFIGNVSDELKEEYKNDLFKQFIKHSPRDSKGRPTHNATELQAMLHKNGSKD